MTFKTITSEETKTEDEAPEETTEKADFFLEYNAGVYICHECNIRIQDREQFSEHADTHVKQLLFTEGILMTLGPRAPDQINLLFQADLHPLIKTVNVKEKGQAPLAAQNWKRYVLQFSVVDGLFICRTCDFQTNCRNRASFHCFRNLHTVVGDFNAVVCKKCTSENTVALMNKCHSISPLIKYLHLTMKDSPTNVIASHTASSLSHSASTETPLVHYILKEEKKGKDLLEGVESKLLANIVENLKAKASNVGKSLVHNQESYSTNRIHSRKSVRRLPMKRNLESVVHEPIYDSGFSNLAMRIKMEPFDDSEDEPVKALKKLEKQLVDDLPLDDLDEDCEEPRSKLSRLETFMCSKCPFKMNIGRKDAIYEHIISHEFVDNRLSNVSVDAVRSLAEWNYPSTSNRYGHNPKDGFYACGFDGCFYGYRTFAELRRHLSSHRNFQKMPCFYCSDDGIYRPEELELHMRRHENKLQFALFKCSVAGCSYFAHQLQDFASHLAVRHHSTRCFDCELCTGEFYNYKDFIKHVSDGIAYKLDCPHCSYDCPKYAQMKEHYEQFHPSVEKQEALVSGELLCVNVHERDSSEEFEDMEDMTDSIDPSERSVATFSEDDLAEGIDPDDIPYAPETGTEGKGGKFRLKVSKAGNKIKVDCGLCGTTFSQLSEAIKHCDKHHPNRRLGKPCNLCGFSHSDKTKIQEHLRWHKKERDEKKRFQCEHCPFSVEQASFLKCHLFHHSEHGSSITVYRCRYCTISSNVESIIEDHMQNSHPLKSPAYDVLDETIDPKDFFCPFCGGFFSNLLRHIRKVHDVACFEAYTKEFCAGSKMKTKFANSNDRNSSNSSRKILQMDPVDISLSPLNKTDASVSLLFNKRVRVITYSKRSSWNQGPVNDAFKGRLGQLACQFCEFSSSHLGNFTMHLLREMKDSGRTYEVRIFKCANCPYRAMLPSAIREHHDQKHSKRTFGLIPQDICVMDGKEFNDKEELKTVEESMDEESHSEEIKPNAKSLSLHCPLCTFETQLLRNVRRHIEREHKRNVLMYSCRFCRSFKDNQPAALSQHMLDCHPGYPNYLCDIIIDSAKEAEESADESSEKQTNPIAKSSEDMNLTASKFVAELPLSFIFDKPVPCPFCDFASKTRADVMQHINEHILGNASHTDSSGPKSSPPKEKRKLKRIDWDEQSEPPAEISVEDEEDSNDDLESDDYEECNCDENDGNDPLLKLLIEDENKDIQYKCKECGLEETDRLDLIEHVAKDHLEEKIYSCNYCEKNDYSARRVRHHVRRAHRHKEFKLTRNVPGDTERNFSFKMKKPDSVKSKEIDEPFLKDALSRKILRFAESTDGWQCSLCGSKMSTPRALRRHVLGQHTSIRPIKCAYCSQKFVDMQAGCEHAFKTHGAVPKRLIRCTIKPDEFEMSVFSQGQAKTEKSAVIQPTSSNQVSNTGGSSSLKDNSSSIHRLHCCIFCDLSSKWSASDLRVHVYHKHMGKYQFKCTYCDYGSRTTKAVSAHIEREHGSVSHTVRDNSHVMNTYVQVVKEKKMDDGTLCLYYGPIEGYNGPIIASKRSATKSPIKCNYCPASFTTTEEFREHNSTEHGSLLKPIVKEEEGDEEDEETEDSPKATSSTSPGQEEKGKCKICSKVVMWHSIRHHVMSHLQYKPYKCALCKYETTRNYPMKKHMRSIHSFEGEPIKERDQKMENEIVKYYEKLGAEGEETVKTEHVSEDDTEHSPAKEKPLVEPKPNPSNFRSPTTLVFDAINYVCPMCDDFKTTSKQAMLLHLMDKEMRYTPYKCAECGFTGCTVTEMKKHSEKLHTDCSVKVLKFKDKEKEDMLNDLMDKANVKKPSENSESQESTTFEYSMNVDGTTVPKELFANRRAAGVFQCLKCPHETAIWPKMKIHYLRHGFKRFGCDYCHLAFYLSGEGHKHVRERHPNKKEGIHPLAVILQGGKPTYFKETQVCKTN